jgi:hypothetical protein
MHRSLEFSNSYSEAAEACQLPDPPDERGRDEADELAKTLTPSHPRARDGHFPPVPNRWLVARSTPAGVIQWIVESDYLYPVGDPGAPE